MLFVALLLAALAPHALETPPPGPSELVATFGPFRPRVGAWVEYLVRSPGQQEVRLRIAVTPPALDRGRAWLEVAAVGSRSLPFATRFLLNAATGKLERAAIYALGQAPIEVPIGDEHAAGSAVRVVRTVRRRPKTVSVPAGTFSATELRVGEGSATARVWKSEQVPLWGMVRAQEGLTTIELVRFGASGAFSVFPGVYGNGSESANE